MRAKMAVAISAIAVALCAGCELRAQDAQAPPAPPDNADAAAAATSPNAGAMRVRIAGNVTNAKLTKKVEPVYPQIARTAHIQGTVVLRAIISKDGDVQQLVYISGPALLMRASMDAVRQWKYQPTLLNGERVEVDTTISVPFAFGGPAAADDESQPQKEGDSQPPDRTAGTRDSAAPTSPPPAGQDGAAPTSHPMRVRIGGNVQMAKMTHQVQPKYPKEAKQNHITGTVVLHAVIAKDGTIQELQFVSGPPELMRSAMDAVKKWRYKPTELEGRPVEVDTTISVIYTLSG